MNREILCINGGKKVGCIYLYSIRVGILCVEDVKNGQKYSILIHSKWMNKMFVVKMAYFNCAYWTACMSVSLQCENVTAEYKMCKDKGILIDIQFRWIPFTADGEEYILRSARAALTFLMSALFLMYHQHNIFFSSSVYKHAIFFVVRFNLTRGGREYKNVIIHSHFFIIYNVFLSIRFTYIRNDDTVFFFYLHIHCSCFVSLKRSV